MVNLKIHNIGLEACDPLQIWSGVKEFYSIHLVIQGKGSYQVDDRQLFLESGDIFLIYPDRKVTYWADEAEPWEYLWLGISGHSVKNILNFTEFSPENLVIHPEKTSDLKDLLLDIYRAQGTNLHSELEMVGLTYVFLSHLVSEHSNSGAKQSPHYPQKAKEFIDLNYSRGITPHGVAEKLNISRSHLHRVFKGEFGLSVGSYITDLQMERAKELLITTDLTIQEVSNSVGFENPLYFSEVFKLHQKLAPSYYRKKEKNSGAGGNKF